MLGKSDDLNKKGSEQAKRFPPDNPFSKKQTGNLQQPQTQQSSSPVQSKKNSIDNFQRTNKAERGTGPLMANSNINLSEKPVENRVFTEKSLDDGTTIVQYKEPQKIDTLIKDAKKRVGGETAKFFSKGWVIGNELAKISPDGKSITYYPTEVADLVQELISSDSSDV